MDITKRVASTAVAVLLGTAAVAGPAAADPLDGVSGYLTTREGIVQVAVYDNLTGKTSIYSEGPAKQYTASIQKVDILAGWLRQVGFAEAFVREIELVGALVKLRHARQCGWRQRLKSQALFQSFEIVVIGAGGRPQFTRLDLCGVITRSLGVLTGDARWPGAREGAKPFRAGRGV